MLPWSGRDEVGACGIRLTIGSEHSLPFKQLINVLPENVYIRLQLCSLYSVSVKSEPVACSYFKV